MRRFMLLACVVVATLAPRAHAQGDPEILLCGDFGFHSFPFGGAISNLGLLDQTTSVFQREDLLLDALRSREWDLVIIRWFDRFRGPDGAAVVDELAAHVDRGGTMIFSMAELDSEPEMWPILGIEDAVDLEEPLKDIRPPRGGYLNPPERHPAFSSRPALIASDDPIGPDFGDVLQPTPGSFVIAEFVDDLGAGIVLSRDGRVIVNGQQWDNWGPGTQFAEDQIVWLLGCQADVDLDGELTVFDFIEFQNRFDAGGGDGFADFCYDGRLDVFDFLEFLNLFQSGC